MRNLGQSNCRRCQRPHYGCVNAGCIDDAQWNELIAYAKQEGHFWKRNLRLQWSNGSEVLRWARNLLGPSGLDKVILNAEKYERKIGGRIITGKPTKMMPIEEWFDPHDHSHVKAWKYLCEHGVWPEGFIPDYVDLSSVWTVLLANKLADAWVDYILTKDYVESIP